MGNVTASNVSIVADNIAIDKTNGNSTSTLSAYGNSGADDYVWDKLLLYATYDAGIYEWKINGNADFLFDGRLYMPDYNYVVSGNMSQVGGCFGIIANRIKYDGSSGTDNASGQNCIDGGAAGAGISTIRLVE